MAPLLKNNSTQGLYILEEENGRIAANLPGDIDLGNLSLGDTYIYFDNILRFEEKFTANREGDDWIGFKTWNVANHKTQASTGGAYRVYYMSTVESNETTAQYLKTLAALNVIPGDGLKFLVKQTASEAFELFPNDSGVNKKATAIIIRGYNAVEIASGGKDFKLINIVCERITQR
jgi:hypothetical protein